MLSNAHAQVVLVVWVLLVELVVQVLLVEQMVVSSQELLHPLYPLYMVEYRQ